MENMEQIKLEELVELEVEFFEDDLEVEEIEVQYSRTEARPRTTI